MATTLLSPHCAFLFGRRPCTSLMAAAPPQPARMRAASLKPPGMCAGDGIIELRRRHLRLRPRPAKDAYKGFPPMQKKPAWYWRFLACLPYLMPLCESWMYAKTAYNVHYFIQMYTLPFLRGCCWRSYCRLWGLAMTGYQGSLLGKNWGIFLDVRLLHLFVHNSDEH